ncbi:MAG: AMP-binding protein, partial [Deltaproteobacteria bacterium]|nr:AMP-binding protein [Deltaproteobacteria bacterium]
MNISKNLENAALYFPDRPAVIEEDRKISYRELNQETNRIASALKNMGLQPGDRMALCAPGSYRWMTLYFGALKAGA